MKLTIVFAGLLGVFLAPAFASYNINVNDDNNSAGSGQQSVSIDNAHNVANVDNNNGWNPWNTLWDYQTGFAATRISSKKVCFVHRLNKDAVPPIDVLDDLAKKHQLPGEESRASPPKSLRYAVNPHQVGDLSIFGKAISNMCRNIPTYMAEEIKDASLFVASESCFQTSILWILDIAFCGEKLES